MASSGNNTRVAFIFLGLAVLVACVAIYGIFSILKGYQRAAYEADRPIDTVTVVAASRVLYQGVAITPDDLFVVNVPPDYLPVVKNPKTNEVEKVQTFQSRDRVVGQVPRERILANEFIRPERLADGSAGVGLNAVIPRGMRAISVGLKGADAVAGFLTPGNYVDVLVTMKDEFNRRRTETILQAVFVLGVNSRAQNDTTAEPQGGRGKVQPSVTFLVTPKQAEDIAYADEIGDISLTLRNVQDVTYTALSGADLDTLLGRLIPKAEPEAVPQIITRRTGIREAPATTTYQTGTTITVIRGNNQTVEAAQGY